MESLILIGKWIGGIVATLFVAAVVGTFRWFFNSLEEAHRKISNTYDKKEVNDLVDSKIIPLKDALDSHKNATEKLITATDRLTETISQLNTRMAVVETRIESK